MKAINNYIFEKFKIAKDIENRDPSDYWDARTFVEDDIVYVHPNVSRGLNKPGTKGKPQFMRILKNDGQKITFILLDGKYTEKGKDKGEAIPNKDKIVSNKISVKIDNSGFAKYKSMVIYLWDEKPLDYWE